VSRESQISRLFVTLADTLVDDFDVVELLQTLAEASAELLDVDAVGLMLADLRGGIQLVAFSPESLQSLEMFELQVDEGPCLDSFRTGEAVVNISMTHAFQRWPRFTAEALAAGMGATHALPLRLRGEVIGAMNLMSTSAQMLAEADLTLGQALADVATIGLLQQRAIQEQTLLAEQLQTALNSRVLIEQAKGVLAERTGTTPAEAFGHLRRYARNSGTSLPIIARAVIENTIDSETVRA
jgi:transcriptional regulator with GAF, ATPase, and Fis domain